MNLIACYPRSMSAWLSNLLTVPHVSLYAHDILRFPDMVEVLESTAYAHKGIVDTSVEPDLVPEGWNLIVIDSDFERVAERCRRVFDDIDITPLRDNMEALKDMGPVYHMDDLEEWIEDFFKEHTGVLFDWGRYRVLRNLNVQSQLGSRLWP